MTQCHPFLLIIHVSFTYYNIFCKNCCARSLFGAAKNSAGALSSTSFPPSKKRTRSATSFANPISCVTIAIVIPVVTNDFITSNTSFTISGSSAEVGSSNNITSGSIANALAIATRCFCPPERRFGYVSFLSNKPTFSNSFSAFFSASCFVTPFTLIGAYVIFSNTVI
ncbi:conserved hypothetical protein protein [Bacillus cereus G9241]|nr:conserved hypothetical protein protein [Bacillus cereus G9241]